MKFNDHRKIKITQETNCGMCAHKKVCNRNVEERCVNFVWGRSDASHCDQCVNHYSRFDEKDPVPCFLCNDFLHESRIKTT